MTPYEQGEAARRAGKHPSQCPLTEPAARKQWLDGWHGAKQEAPDA